MKHSANLQIVRAKSENTHIPWFSNKNYTHRDTVAVLATTETDEPSRRLITPKMTNC